jgi:hypothetical protein
MVVSMEKFAGLPFWISVPVQLISLIVGIIVGYAIAFSPRILPNAGE